MSYFINIKPTFLKLWVFTNLNMVFPVVVLDFDFNRFFTIYFTILFFLEIAKGQYFM
jgi:hypothetical protein